MTKKRRSQLLFDLNQHCIDRQYQSLTSGAKNLTL